DPPSRDAAGIRGRKERIDADGTGEIFCRSLAGWLRSVSCDLHCSVLTLLLAVGVSAVGGWAAPLRRSRQRQKACVGAWLSPRVLDGCLHQPRADPRLRLAGFPACRPPLRAPIALPEPD